MKRPPTTFKGIRRAILRHKKAERRAQSANKGSWVEYHRKMIDFLEDVRGRRVDAAVKKLVDKLYKQPTELELPNWVHQQLYGEDTRLNPKIKTKDFFL